VSGPHFFHLLNKKDNTCSASSSLFGGTFSTVVADTWHLDVVQNRYGQTNGHLSSLKQLSLSLAQALRLRAAGPMKRTHRSISNVHVSWAQLGSHL
jgi:hypothetical protein